MFPISPASTKDQLWRYPQLGQQADGSPYKVHGLWRWRHAPSVYREYYLWTYICYIWQIFSCRIYFSDVFRLVWVRLLRLRIFLASAKWPIQIPSHSIFWWIHRNSFWNGVFCSFRCPPLNIPTQERHQISHHTLLYMYYTCDIMC